MLKHKVRRSGLTMPVVTARFVDNAWRRGCDFVLLDLEDSVPQHRKADARALIKESIPKLEQGAVEPFVRINHDYMLADLEGAIWPGIRRVRYPKTEYADEIRRVDEILTRLERERGIRHGTIEIDPGIETAVGVSNVYAIAGASERIKEFGGTSGGYDLSRDLGIEMFVEFDQFFYIRGEGELAARARGIPVRVAPFLANPSGSVSDGNRALEQAEAARKCGFYLGLGGLNPAVVESHNVGYTPTDEEVRDARWVLDEFAKLAGSSETWVEVNGRVIDRYEAERARGLLEWAAAVAERDREKAQAVARTSDALARRAGT